MTPSPKDIEKAREIYQELIDVPLYPIEKEAWLKLAKPDCIKIIAQALHEREEEVRAAERIKKGCCFAGVAQACPIHES